MFIFYVKQFAQISLCLSLFILFIPIISCENNFLSGYKTTFKKRINSKIILNRTSKDYVTINDNDGWGLLDGNVKKISYLNKNTLRVAYDSTSAKSDTVTTTRSLKLVDIDLESLKISSISDPDGSIINSLEPIEIFFP